MKKGERQNMVWIISSYVMLLILDSTTERRKGECEGQSAEKTGLVQKKVFSVTERICQGRNDFYSGSKPENDF